MFVSQSIHCFLQQSSHILAPPRRGTALDDLKSSHAKLSSDKLMSDSHHATLKDSRRFGFVVFYPSLADCGLLWPTFS